MRREPAARPADFLTLGQGEFGQFSQNVGVAQLGKIVGPGGEWFIETEEVFHALAVGVERLGALAFLHGARSLICIHPPTR